MALTPYRRAKQWSSKYAIERIEAKRGLVAQRRRTIKLQVEQLRVREATFRGLEELSGPGGVSIASRSLSAKVADGLRRVEVLVAEDEELQKLEAGLMEALEAERLKPRRSRVSDGGSPTSGGQVANDRSADASGPRATVRVAGSSGAGARYDKALCLFRSDSRPLSDEDRRARPVDRSDAWTSDPLMDRLLRVVEVPGLAHWMFLGEREYAVTDVSGLDVPAGCEGLPSAPAFAGDLFSADALEQLADPENRQGYLLKVGGAES